MVRSLPAIKLEIVHYLAAIDGILAAKAFVQVMWDLSSIWNGSVVFAGEDMPCDDQPNSNMSTCILSSNVPQDLRGRFRFAGRIKRGSLGDLAIQERIRFVVLPSMYETFCLAAHEAAFARLPVVLPRLPAYEGYFFDGQNAFMFDTGSVEQLARVCKTALTDTSAYERMKAHQGAIAYPDPAVGYRRLTN
jgi:hypothetical protein